MIADTILVLAWLIVGLGCYLGTRALRFRPGFALSCFLVAIGPLVLLSVLLAAAIDGAEIVWRERGGREWPQ